MITIKKAQTHNLQKISLQIPLKQFIVFTGVSGSGKSSLAFDTLYTEGQRRYLLSVPGALSTQGLQLPRVEVEEITFLPPTIAIQQKTSGHNPRSTIGTLTGIYDYLRILFARLGIAHCPLSQEPVTPTSRKHIAETLLAYPLGTEMIVLAPYAIEKKGTFVQDFYSLLQKGFLRVRIDGAIYTLGEDLPKLDKNTHHNIDLVIDRIVLKEHVSARIHEALQSALDLGQGQIRILIDKRELFFSETAFSAKSGKYYPSLEPYHFSFNHPQGMCTLCEGLGYTESFLLDAVIDSEKSLAENAISLTGSYNTVKWKNLYDNLARIYGFQVTTPWKDLSGEAKNILLYGTKKKWTTLHCKHPVTGKTWIDYVQWKGVIAEGKRRKERSRLQKNLCSACNGSRLQPYPSATRFQGVTIQTIIETPIEELLPFFQKIHLQDEQQLIGKDLLTEIIFRLEFLKRVGLSYLTLDRAIPTLSGGETQRIRLASHMGGGLVGALYILDEPSIGLHPSDQAQLIIAIKQLRDRGNTVIVVEHDEGTIKAADHVIDIGPGAGIRGGKIVAEGTPQDISLATDSITGAFLSGKQQITYPKSYRTPKGSFLQLAGASLHNLQNVDLKIPLGLFVAICGVSGSGKSSLIMETLYPAVANQVTRSTLPTGPFHSINGWEPIEKVIAIDQSPIGRTPRSNPATYTKIFDSIRDLFAALPESLAQGFDKGRFSFNTPEGCCTHCKGYGMCKIDMDFLEEEWILCPNCKGKRFDEKTLQVTYREKTIYDVLSLTLEEACVFFENIPSLQKKLQLLCDVGLGYIQLGQSATTLSGGEAQRIKLSRELLKPQSGHTLYILDEPTTGLHLADINKLLSLIQQLVDQKNTVVMIEHNTECIKCADHIIDMGPFGGKGGGKIIAEGNLDSIRKGNSPTAPYLSDSPKLTKKSSKTPIKTPVGDITIRGARQNNLQNLSVTVPRHQITVFTGPSGSGKTSLAFDTLYNEGQRQYIETLPPYVRQQIGETIRPHVDDIKGLSPTIALEQVHASHNPRSTLGTMTEIYDYLRVLYATAGVPFAPDSNHQIEHITPEYVTDRLLELPVNTKLYILSPLDAKKIQFTDLLSQGYLRVRINGVYYEITENLSLKEGQSHAIELVVDRLLIKENIRTRLLEAVQTAQSIGQNTVIGATETEDFFYNLAFADPKTGISYPSITPKSFSFNVEQGMCPNCEGLGVQWASSLIHNKHIKAYTPWELCEFLFYDPEFSQQKERFLTFFQHANIDCDTPIKELPPQQQRKLFKGVKTPFTLRGMQYQWKGLDLMLQDWTRQGTSQIRQTLKPHMQQLVCPECNGSRLNALARNVRLQNVTLPELCQMPLSQAQTFIKQLPATTTLTPILEALLMRLRLLCEIGLGYLSLGRAAATLSGGELQRARLSRQLGSGLTGTLYVLDEPTIGLHPHNNAQINTILRELRDRDNTLILVEHDPLTMQIADNFLDFGPQSGANGGHIVAQGSYSALLKDNNSLTGKYLSGKMTLPYPTQRREAQEYIDVKNANKHNLQKLSVKIPLNLLVGVSGVSGAGKSTLVHQVLRRAWESYQQNGKAEKVFEFEGATFTNLQYIDSIIVLSQTFSKVTSRSDILTYLEILTPLRQFFAQLPEAAAAGLSPRHFSYNHKAGMCKTCQGLGTQTIHLQYLSPVQIPCKTCHGNRLKPLSLNVRYKGKNLGQILRLTIAEAQTFLPHLPKLHAILDCLLSVGLGYLPLGQGIATLSGGEMNRIRLSKELLKKPSANHILYLLDEPTTGLHFQDIAYILPLLRQLVEKGHSVFMIEHNTDALKFCDYLIDMGPGSSEEGGKIVVAGSYETVKKSSNSYTAKYL